MFKGSARKNMEPIDLDIHFPDGLSKSDIAHLAIELLKMLLLQRHQIPVQIEKLKCDALKHSHLVEPENIQQMKIPGSNVSYIAHELPRDRKRRARDARLKTKYIKKSHKFLDIYNKLEYCLSTELMSNRIKDVISICYVFGTSVTSPKELYRIVLPRGCLKASTDIVNRRIMMQLFRTMTTDEKLFSRMDVKLRRTNLFIALEMSPNGNENNYIQNLSTKNEFQFPPRSKMSKLTSFVLSHNSDFLIEETPAKTRKYNACVQHVLNTPQPMEMCTPLTSRPNASIAKYSGLYNPYNHEYEMEVTPCVKTHEPQIKNKCSRLPPYSRSRDLSGDSASVKNISEIEYSVLEAEKMLNNTSLDSNQDKQITDNPMSQSCGQWLFFNHILKGFDDPQLY